MIQIEPLLDPTLSLRARGIWALFIAANRVLSVAEIYDQAPEGRDAIRNSLRELVDAGYLTEERTRTRGGHFAHQYLVTRPWKSVHGKSGHLHICTEEHLLAINTSTSDNSSNGLVELTNVSSTTPSGKPDEKEEFVEMSWPGFEDEVKPKKSRIDDSDTGSIGKITDPIDKAEMRKQKYKKVQFAAVPESMLRTERPEEEWTTADLVAEFYDLTHKHADGAPSQVNGAQLSTWINQQVGKGVPRAGILRAMRAFFNDPRLIREPGVGKPFWRRFVAFYPTVHGLYAKEKNIDYADDDFIAHQNKMLKLLEG